MGIEITGGGRLLLPSNVPAVPGTTANNGLVWGGGGWVSGSIQLAGALNGTAPYTIYIDVQSGNDANNGRSAGQAVLTINKAVNVLQQSGHGGEIRIVSGPGAGFFDVTSPIVCAWPIRIVAPLTASATLRRTFATPNSRSVWDAVTTVAGSSVQSATAAFGVNDVHRIAVIYGAGLNGGTFHDFISAVPDATHATLTATTTIARNSTTDPHGVKLSVCGDWNRVVTDASMVAGGSVITSAGAAWTVNDIGTEVVIAGAGQGGQALRTAIKSVSGSTATVVGVSTATITNVRCAIGVNFGNLFSVHVGQCGLSRVVLTDQTSGNGTVGAAIEVYAEDQGAGSQPSPSDLDFEHVTVTSTDTAGAWEHIVSADGSWNQNTSGPGNRRVNFHDFKPFGARTPGENLRLNTVVHWNFVGSVGMVSAPTTLPQGIMILDPQQTAGYQRGTADVHFTAFEGYYLYSEGQMVTYVGGRLITVFALSGRNVIELSSASDRNWISTAVNAGVNAGEIDQGTNNVIRTTRVTDTREHAAFNTANASVKHWRETVDHRNSGTPLTVISGQLMGAPIRVLAGEKYGHILIQTTGTAPTWGSNNDGHWYMAVYDSSLNLVTQTADQGHAGWTSGLLTALALNASFVPQQDGLYYATLMLYLGTGGVPVAPQFQGVAAMVLGTPVINQPRACILGNNALTTGTAPATLTVSGSAQAIPYFMLYT